VQKMTDTDNHIAAPKALVLMGAEARAMQFDNRRWHRLESLADLVEPGWVTSMRDPDPWRH